MKCYPRQLTCAVKLLLFFLSLSFSLDLEELAREKLKEAYGEEVRLAGIKKHFKGNPSFQRVELKLYRNSPRGYLYLKNGKVYTVSLEVEWLCRLPVAKRDINRGERLRPGAYEIVERYMKRCPRIPGEDLLNFVAKRNIRKGELITRSLLRKEFLVRRGQRVKAFYETSSLSLSFETQALDNGYLGDLVRVRSPFSDRVLRGVVVGEGTVKIQ